MNDYPLHYCVFQNDFKRLKELLDRNKEKIDQKDLRDKTPLELAIILENIECARVLVENGADCSIITKHGWNLLQEAVSTGNVDFVKLLMKYKNYQRSHQRLNGIPEILNKLKQAPDFYVEMKWEFTSWIPLVAKTCPSDVYKIYKSGSKVRIDTTLVGFNGTNWERGNKSYIFQAKTDGASITELDHLTQTVFTDNIRLADADALDSISEPTAAMVEAKLTSPNITTFLDIDKIEFERNRSGVWGWRSDKIEDINGYECKAYAANNLQLVTKTRLEHLDENEKKYAQQSTKVSNNINLPSFLTSFFTGSEQNTKIEKPPNNITVEQYFNKHIPVPEYLQRTIEECKKTQTFNANLSLSEDYPLSLHEQLLPIVDLMALTNSHFKKLKEFITLQLPRGFPVKIEIPLYRVITAKVTFGNIHGTESEVQNVTTIYENAKPLSICNEQLFKIPSGYSELGAATSRRYVAPMDDEDILLQLAIQQSLSGSEEPLNNEDQLTALEMFGYRQPSSYQSTRFNYNNLDQNDEDLILQRVLAESLMTSGQTISGVTTTESVEDDELYGGGAGAAIGSTFDYEKALELSRKQAEREREERELLRKQEDEELQRILMLSLTEK